MNRIAELRKRRGLSQFELGRQVGAAQNSVSNWENGTREPDNSTLLKLAGIFDVTVDHLLGHTSNPINRKKPYRRIPVLGSVPAGVPFEAIEDEIDWEDLGEEYLNTGFDYVGLLVKGDSMLPEYRNGDVLIVRIQSCAESGDDAVVFVNGEDATFKRFNRTDRGIMLRPLNPDFEPLFFTPKEVDSLPVNVFGIAVEVRRKIQK